MPPDQALFRSPVLSTPAWVGTLARGALSASDNYPRHLHLPRLHCLYTSLTVQITHSFLPSCPVPATGAGVPAAILACNSGLGACMVGCVAAGCVPVIP